MHCKTQPVVVMSLLTIALVVGCAKDTTFELSRDASGTSGGNIWNRDQNAVAATGASASASPTDSIARVFRRVSTTVSDAWPGDPHPEPPGDPARLSSQPEALTPTLYLRAAAWSEQQGALDKARQQYEKAVELDPENVLTMVALARFHDRQENQLAAAQWYSRARQLEPDNIVVLNDLGLFHARRSEFTPALDALQQAVRLAPQNVRYHNNLAGVLVQAGRPDEAVTTLQPVHGEAIANLNVGNFLYMHKDLDAAAVYFRRAQNLEPSLVAARDLLAHIDRSTARVEPAAAWQARTLTARADAGADASPYRTASTTLTSGLETRASLGTRLPPTTSQTPSQAGSPPEGPRRLPVPQ
jgi:Flp pilus assembly protein TadD